MRSWLLLLLVLLCPLSDGFVGEPEKPADIRIRLQDVPLRDAKKIEELQDKLKKMGIAIDDLTVSEFRGRIPSARVQYDEKVSVKRITGVVEFLWENGFRHFTFEPLPLPIEAVGRLVAEEKQPPLVGKAEFVRLHFLRPAKGKELAGLTNAVEAARWRVTTNDVFKVEGKNKEVQTCKVVHFEPREVIILVQQTYYAIHIGASIAEAMEMPLSKKQFEEMKLPAPK